MVNMNEVVLKYSSAPTAAGIPTAGTVVLDGDRAGGDWANVLCSACGRGYVNEEDHFSIYDADAVEQLGGAGEWRVHTAVLA